MQDAALQDWQPERTAGGRAINLCRYVHIVSDLTQGNVPILDQISQIDIFHLPSLGILEHCFHVCCAQLRIAQANITALLYSA